MFNYGAISAFVICLLTQPNQGQQQPGASFGDLHMIPGDHGVYKIQVFLPQGNGREDWAEICLEGSGDSEDIGTVICRQYGHISGTLTVQPNASRNIQSSNAVSLWLHAVHCGPSASSLSHILRCSYVLNDTRCTNSAYVKCGDEKLTDKPYNGQVYLCPPKDFEEMEHRSTSTGLVLVYLHHSWGTIFGVKQLGSYEKDTLCRQLGFTRSNSVYTLYDYGHCYREDGTTSPSANAVWLTATQFNCKSGGSKACAGCCYQYPSSHSTVSTQIDDLQLSCTFDPKTKDQQTGGNSNQCSFAETGDNTQTLKIHDSCGLQDQSSLVVPLLGTLLGLVTIISLILGIVVCVRTRWLLRHRRERQPLVGGDNRNRPNDLRNPDDEN